MNARATLLGSLPAFLLAAACGGATATELFGEPEVDRAGTAPGGSDAGGAPGSGGSSSGGSSSSSSGGSSSGGSSSSSGGDPDPAPDAGPGPANPGTYCGEDGAGQDVYCAAGTYYCCASGDPDARSFTCKSGSPATTCQGGLAIRCDDTSDCAGNAVCCGAFSNGAYRSVACRTTCESFPGVTAVRFCDPDAPTDQCAGLQATCQPSEALPGYSVCR